MTPPNPLQEFTFVALGIITVGSALLVVWLRNLIHAALMLGVSFVGVAGLYLMLNAEFVAAAQVLVYVGAITVLILFAIMLTQGLSGGQFIGPIRYQPLVGGIVAGWTFLILGWFLYSHTWPGPYGNQLAPVPHTVSILGIQLLTTYIIPFEVSSVLLLVALVAAIVLARDEKTVSIETYTNVVYDESDPRHAIHPASQPRPAAPGATPPAAPQTPEEPA